MEIPLKMIPFQNAFLWVKKNHPSDSAKESALILLSKEDMEEAGIAPGRRLIIKTDHDRIDAFAKLDESCPKGFAFMPKSPLINRLMVFKEGLPNAEGINVTAVIDQASE